MRMFTAPLYIATEQIPFIVFPYTQAIVRGKQSTNLLLQICSMTILCSQMISYNSIRDRCNQSIEIRNGMMLRVGFRGSKSRQNSYDSIAFKILRVCSKRVV